MSNKIGALLSVCLLSFPVFSLAAATNNTLPTKGLFVGLGGSFNSVYMKETDSLVGISKVYSGSTLVASGIAQGPTTPINITETTFAPNGQMGYFMSFPMSNWLGGVKLTYGYLGTTLTENNIVAPQAGTFTTLSGTDSFTGHATIGSMQTSVNHELALIPFIGRSFGQGFFYLGMGPVLLSTESHIYAVTGYADINGIHLDVSGKPTSFSSNKWVWGGDAQVGMTYYLTSNWFIDFSYAYAITAPYTTNYSAPFSSFSGGDMTTGTLIGSTNQRIIAQTFMVTINAVAL
jgi:hypothetical protein